MIKDNIIVLLQSGMIRTLEDTFYIQPLPSHLVTKNGFNDGHPHVIYRRSTEEDLSSDYHVSGNKQRTFAQKMYNTDFAILLLQSDNELPMSECENVVRRSPTTFQR